MAWNEPAAEGLALGSVCWGFLVFFFFFLIVLIFFSIWEVTRGGAGRVV